MSQELDKLFGDADPKKIERAIKQAIAENKERIAKIDINQHWRDAIKYVDEQFAFFCSDILNMGKPEWDTRIPTAAVYMPKDKTDLSDFRFIANPIFCALLEVKEFAFILGHETMHILYNHLKVGPSMEKQGAKMEKVNISMDVICNDFLVDQGFELSGRLAKNLCTGEKWCGYNAKSSTVREVYRDLNHDKYEQMKGMQDALSKYLAGLDLPATGGHQWIYSQEDSQGVAEAMGQGDNIPPQIQDQKDSEDQKTKKMSAGAASNEALVNRFQETEKVSLRWAKLLSAINPDLFRLHGPGPTPSFARIPRKLQYAYEKWPNMGRLPSMDVIEPKRGEQPAIVMYLDGSGSCSDWIDRFVTLAKSVPENKIALFPFSFSTHTMKLEIKQKNPKVCGGGTEFSCIEESIHRDVVPVLGSYPKAVVVLSDGEGVFQRGRPIPQHQERWLWLIKTHNGQKYAYPDRCGADVMIEDFMDGMK